MRINDNIQTGVKYIKSLLFKRLYAAGLAWLDQGLGTRGTSVKQEMTGTGGRKLRWETRGPWWHRNRYQWNREHRDEGWDKGNRDKWRSVRDVTEIGMDLGDRRYSRGWWSRMDLSEMHQWSVSNSFIVIFLYFIWYKRLNKLCVFYLICSMWCAGYMRAWVYVALVFIHIECD